MHLHRGAHDQHHHDLDHLDLDLDDHLQCRPPPRPRRRRPTGQRRALAAAQALTGATGTTTGANRRATVEGGRGRARRGGRHAGRSGTAGPRASPPRWRSTPAPAVSTRCSRSTPARPPDPAIAGLTGGRRRRRLSGTGSQVRFASAAGTTYGSRWAATAGAGRPRPAAPARRVPVSDAFAAPRTLAPPAAPPRWSPPRRPRSRRARPRRRCRRTGVVLPTAPRRARSPSRPAAVHDTVLAVYTGSGARRPDLLAGDDDTCELGARTGVLATAGYRPAASPSTASTVPAAPPPPPGTDPGRRQVASGT